MSSGLGPSLSNVAMLCYEAGLTYRESAQYFRKAYIEGALRKYHGNKCRTARAIGIHRNTLQRLIDELQIDVRKINGRQPADAPRRAA